MMYGSVHELVQVIDNGKNKQKNMCYNVIN